MADRVQRKGNLEPKNSTRLFTTGFVEIVDVIPQMSTIRLEAGKSITLELLGRNVQHNDMMGRTYSYTDLFKGEGHT